MELRSGDWGTTEGTAAVKLLHTKVASDADSVPADTESCGLTNCTELARVMYTDKADDGKRLEEKNKLEEYEDCVGEEVSPGDSVGMSCEDFRLVLTSETVKRGEVFICPPEGNILVPTVPNSEGYKGDGERSTPGVETNAGDTSEVRTGLLEDMRCEGSGNEEETAD
ncbi:hypothetical protein ACOMHN_001267 [Nucella lapillus]